MTLLVLLLIVFHTMTSSQNYDDHKTTLNKDTQNSAVSHASLSSLDCLSTLFFVVVVVVEVEY